MFSLAIYIQSLDMVVAFALLTWLLSLYKGDVSMVDSLWPLMFVILAVDNAVATGHWGSRSILIVSLVTAWALRLSIYITWRNWGHGEDRRYQAIRARNQPNFSLKSLYLVFGVQAALAWIISLPLHGAIVGDDALRMTDVLGAALWLVGFIFEAGGDWQLARFKADPVNRDKVMDQGLWRWTRHPNYFGDFCIWWGFYLIAAGAGAWWSVIGPLLMSVLLMRVSGVTLLERDIGERRPQYASYMRRTNAFFPGPPKR
jgi:steroid 5-alpha reductase family enzyme